MPPIIFRQWLVIIIGQRNFKFRLDTAHHGVARRILISSFCEVRETYYSAEEATMLLRGENDDSELKSGTSEEEEAKLEHQLQIIREESR